MSEANGSSDIKQSPAQTALADHITKSFKAAAAARYAEEREWGTAGLFDQMKQWLEEDDKSKKLRPMSAKKSQKWPMPITNLFSKAIETNGNALGAEIPRMRAFSENYDASNRRAADAAENVIDAANRESGMDILNPRLAHMVPLWGIGAIYDTIAFDKSTVEVPDLGSPQDASGGQTQSGTGSQSGSASAVAISAGASGPSPQPEEISGQPVGGDQEQTPIEGEEDASPEIEAMGVQTVPTARLKSYLLTPFEFYLPRDCQDANLARWKILRIRQPLGEVKENYPDQAKFIQKDNEETSLAFFYLNMLRSLSSQNSTTNEGEEEFCTLTILWSDWTSIPDEVQKKIAAEWKSLPSEIYEDQGFNKLQAAIEYGLFAVCWKDTILQWAEHPWDAKGPITFFTWRKDCVSVYNKGLSVELIPLTKKLNRIDSLIEREAMSSGTGKWVIANAQQSTVNLSGDPQEVLWYDSVGDGKEIPKYYPGVTNSSLLRYREQTVADIEKLSFSNSVAEGEMPGSGTAFRALAYLGSKAEETRKTQRYLWEMQHELRAKHLPIMARKVWTEPRKAQVRGFNNRFGMLELDIADLDGQYEIQVIQDSSRPKTLSEKLQAIQMAAQTGLVDPKDAQAREYTLNLLGLDELDESDHLDFNKADRDLEKLKQGIQPMESPFTKWDIPLRVLANYTKTEEFEEAPENIRNGILMYAQYICEKLQVAQGAQLGAPNPGTPPPGPPGPPQSGPTPSVLASKGGIGGQPASHVLGQVPGAQVNSNQVEGAAIREAADIVPNSPSPMA